MADGIGPTFFKGTSVSPAGDDPGTIALWAWGFHRVVDYPDRVAAALSIRKRIAVVGHSRNGKTALLAGAMDDRIALVIPHQAGCGGTAPSRTTIRRPRSVKRINTAFPHWFCDNFDAFNDDTVELPFDQHCLVALCAPRPVLYSNAQEDQWANPNGQFEMLRAADPVYQLYGAKRLRQGRQARNRHARQKPPRLLPPRRQAQHEPRGLGGVPGLCRRAFEGEVERECLWHDSHVSKLPKVVIERRCGGNAQIVDHDLARAIGKAPACRGSLLEQNPGALDLFFGDEVNRRDIAYEEGFAGADAKAERCRATNSVNVSSMQ